jgi:hypothetical protein
MYCSYKYIGLKCSCVLLFPVVFRVHKFDLQSETPNERQPVLVKNLCHAVTETRGYELYVVPRPSS